MFPTHQRRDRSRGAGAGVGPESSYGSSSLAVHHQPPAHSQYPSNTYPQQHAPLDSSTHSNHSNNSGHAQTYAPYPKWTPPTAPAPAVSMHYPPQQVQHHEQEHHHPHNNYAQEHQPHDHGDYEHDHYHHESHVQDPSHTGLADQVHHETPYSSESTELLPGQQGYEWKPPAALQAFQAATVQPPVVNDSIPTVVHHQPEPEPEPEPECNDEHMPEPECNDEQHEHGDDSGFTSFLSWGKLEDPVDIAEFLLNDPVICTVADSNGNTFLHAASDVGNISMVQFFLKNFPEDSSTSLKTQNDQGFEPIHMAAFGGMLHVVGLLLKFDPSLAYRRTRSGSTVLHLAVANSNFQLVDFLLDILDDDTVWALNNGGSNALHLACKFGNVAMIDRFAQLPGADVNFRNAVDDTTCVELVCHNFDETMQVLVSSGVKLQAKSASDLIGPKMKALFAAQKVPLKSFSSSDSNDNHSVTVTSPYSPAKLRKSGISLVDKPVAVSSSPVVSPEVTRRKSSSYYPPTNASFVPPPPNSAAKNPKELVKKDSGSKSKSKKITNSKSWIKSSASVDDEAVVKVSSAFEKDASLSGTITVSSGNDNLGNSTPTKETDLKNDQVTEVSPTQSSEKNDSSSDDDGLFQFVRDSKIPPLEAVLGVFPRILRDVNVVRGEDGASLLHVAAKLGSLDVSQYLVEGIGADVNAVDINNRSPLHYAVESCQLILVRYLVKYCGCALDTKDVNGKVALDMLEAAAGEDRDEIERIIQKSAKKPAAKRTKVTIPTFTPA